MSKLNIHTVLKTAENEYTYNIPAIYQKENNTIVYKENDEQNTLTKFNYQTKTLCRENDSLKLKYIFKNKRNTEGLIFIKEINKTFRVNLKTIDIISKQQNIDIKFLVEKEEFNYKIEVL